MIVSALKIKLSSMKHYQTRNMIVLEHNKILPDKSNWEILHESLQELRAKSLVALNKSLPSQIFYLEWWALARMSEIHF